MFRSTVFRAIALALVAMAVFALASSASAHARHHHFRHYSWRASSHRHYARMRSHHRHWISLADVERGIEHAKVIVSFPTEPSRTVFGEFDVSAPVGGSPAFADLDESFGTGLGRITHWATPLNPFRVAAYIRQAAIARGLNPTMAVHVARTEGLTHYVGDCGTSFGPFQLHYGGYHGCHVSLRGLGDRFTAQTGLNARDPATWRQQVDFALDWASQHGWRGDWFGWQRANWTAHYEHHRHHWRA